MSLSEDDFHSTLRRIRAAVSGATDTPEWADDLLRVARAIFLADKRASRKAAEDRWTREIWLDVRVAGADRWSGSVQESLNSLLRVLTSDVWHVTVSGGGTPIDHEPRFFPVSKPAEVALFSGGLDSSSYAIQRSTRPGEPLLLTGQDFADAHAAQERVNRWIQARAQREVVLAVTSDLPFDREGTRLEPSSRSRGFLFTACGIFVAAAFGVKQLAVPENGQLAVNPPLSPDRLAALSTRSVHPWVVNAMNELVSAIGGDVAVHNPFLFKTKGEVCRVAWDSGLTPEALAGTQSCGVHVGARKRWWNCGLCLPCLVRRSGLEAALGDDPSDYQYDLGRPMEPKPAKHLRDLQQWLLEQFDPTSLLIDLPMPPNVSVAEIAEVIVRGRRELSAMLSRHGLGVSAAVGC